MVSGAGRRVTRRADSAAPLCASAACGSSRYPIRAAASWVCRSDRPSSSGPSSASRRVRSPGDRKLVPATANPARYSPIRPADRAAIVAGMSVVRIRAARTNLAPRFGDSRRASPTCAPTDRTVASGSILRGTSCSDCVGQHPTARRACAALAAPLIRSSTAISSIIPAESGHGPPRSASRARNAVNSPTPTAVPVTRPGRAHPCESTGADRLRNHLHGFAHAFDYPPDHRQSSSHPQPRKPLSTRKIEHVRTACSHDTLDQQTHRDRKERATPTLSSS